MIIERRITGLRPIFRYNGTKTKEPNHLVSNSDWNHSPYHTKTKSQVRVGYQPRSRGLRDTKHLGIKPNINRRSEESSVAEERVGAYDQENHRFLPFRPLTLLVIEIDSGQGRRAYLKRVVWIFCRNWEEGLAVCRVIARRCSKVCCTRNIAFSSMAIAISPPETQLQD